MAQLSEHELLEIEIDEAWNAFCDGDPNQSTEHFKTLDPEGHRLLKLAYSRGFTDGAKSILRGRMK